MLYYYNIKMHGAKNIKKLLSLATSVTCLAINVFLYTFHHSN